MKKHIINGLHQIRNRGFDSCGVCFLSKECTLLLEKKASQRTTFDSLELVENLVSNSSVFFHIGIGHTRWATTGKVSDINSHPHQCDNFYTVHNGLIENYEALKEQLKSFNLTFSSETDTEVISVMMKHQQNTHKDASTLELLKRTVSVLQGTWAIVLIDSDQSDCLYVSKHGSPLILGYNNETVWLASEVSGFCGNANKYIKINDDQSLKIFKDSTGIWIDDGHDIVNVTNYDIQNRKNLQIELQIPQSPSPYEYWTEKEIHEQNHSILRAINNGGRINNNIIKLGGLEQHVDILSQIEHLLITGCGTSYYSALYTAQIFKNLHCFTTVQVIDASEFTMNDLPNSKNVGIIIVSQSGETKDCQRVIENIDRQIPCIGVVNSVGSWIAEECLCGVYLNAGREVAVASTKSFTSQITVLIQIALWFSQIKSQLNETEKQKNIYHLWCSQSKSKDYETERHQYIYHLSILHQSFQSYLPIMKEYAINLIKYVQKASNIFILGRGHGHAIALESALKMKELTYKCVEGFAAGSLKHGTFALIDDNTLIFLLCFEGTNKRQMLNAAEELATRGAKIVVITNVPQDFNSKTNILKIIPIQIMDEVTASLISVTFFQFLSMHVSLSLGHNCDFPRNLAKCVTVDG